MLVVSRSRLVVIAIAFVAATAATTVVFALADREPAVDGEAILANPGEYVEPTASVPVTGDLVPDLDLIDEDGASVSLASFRGRPLVVNMWYSTCAPCAREVREFAAVHAELGDQVEFVGINPLDDPGTMRAFADARGVEYRLLRDPGKDWVNAVPIGVYPTTLFVSPGGVILRQTTAIDDDELREIISEVFPNTGS